MAITMDQHIEKYVDFPLTNFPVEEDNTKRMVDVNAVLMPVIKQYNTYFADGNLAACNDLIRSNPDVLDCFFNADKWNWTRDSILSIQRFFLNDIVPFVNALAQNAVGIEDNPTEEQESLVAYSAEKINSIVEKINTLIGTTNTNIESLETEINTEIEKIKGVKTATLTASGWTGAAAPFEQTVSVSGVIADMKPIMVRLLPSSSDTATAKAYNKAFGLISSGSGVVGNGTATFKVYKKPTTDCTVGLKGE